MTRYHEDSGFGNHILYKMCKDFPSNNDPAVIAGQEDLARSRIMVSISRR